VRHYYPHIDTNSRRVKTSGHNRCRRKAHINHPQDTHDRHGKPVQLGILKLLFFCTAGKNGQRKRSQKIYRQVNGGQATVPRIFSFVQRRRSTQLYRRPFQNCSRMQQYHSISLKSRCPCSPMITSLAFPRDEHCYCHIAGIELRMEGISCIKGCLCFGSFHFL
jgi:hypothetical protein